MKHLKYFGDSPAACDRHRPSSQNARPLQYGNEDHRSDQNLRRLVSATLYHQSWDGIWSSARYRIWQISFDVFSSCRHVWNRLLSLLFV